MRAFLVRLPSGVRYWTVLDEELAVVAVADQFLRQVRFGRDGAESTTKAYANGIALFLRWCARSGRSWQAGVEQLGLFMTWLAHAGPPVSGIDAPAAGGALLAGCAGTLWMMMLASLTVRTWGQVKAPPAGGWRGLGVRGGVVLVSLT
jgi:integrase/recombinase XerD